MTDYNNLKNTSNDEKFKKNKDVFLKLVRDEAHLKKFNENKLTEFDLDLNKILDADWNEICEFYFPTNNEKVNLFKGLVLLEKINGRGGSYSINIRVFKELKRINLVTPKLLDWTFKNKSDNPYTPFGWSRYGHIKSYKEYLKFLDEEALKAKNHSIRQRNDITNKQKKKIKKEKKHKERIDITRASNLFLYSKINDYFRNKNNEIVNDIINNNLPFPLFMIPENVIKKIIPNLYFLNEKTLQQLIQVIPRKSPVHIRELRDKAISSKNNLFKNKIKRLFLLIRHKLNLKLLFKLYFVKFKRIIYKIKS